MNTQNETQTTTDNCNAPNWVVLSPRGQNRRPGLERIGAAWDKDDGGLCIRLTGTQIVSNDVYLYPAKSEI